MTPARLLTIPRALKPKANCTRGNPTGAEAVGRKGLQNGCVYFKAIVRFRVLPRLSGRAWGACFQSGIPALPFDGGQPIPPRLTRVGSFGAAIPQATGASRAVGSPFRAKFPPEVCFWHGKTVNRGQDINKGACPHAQSRTYKSCKACMGADTPIRRPGLPPETGLHLFWRSSAPASMSFLKAPLR